MNCIMKNLLLLFLAVWIVACGTNNKKDDKPTEEGMENATAQQQEEVTFSFSKAPASPTFPDAQLNKDLVVMDDQGNGSYTIKYSYLVENYELGVQTSDAPDRDIANSGKGQHIHYIVNNGPYAAHYMSDIDDELEPGNYVVLAFLSRSYHESVKSKGAFFVENLTVGDVAPSAADLTTPHLFYSRPKGTYAGEDAKKVMLDFYLLNCTLSPDGYNVKATINGQEFLIDDWAPYYMEGLPLGDNTIKLALIDADGKIVDSPFNPVERTINLTE